MEKATLNIPNISCGHCVNRVKNALSELDGVSAVDGNPETKDVSVDYDAPATIERIREVLKEIDYPAA